MSDRPPIEKISLEHSGLIDEEKVHKLIIDLQEYYVEHGEGLPEPGSVLADEKRRMETELLSAIKPLIVRTAEIFLRRMKNTLDARLRNVSVDDLVQEMSQYVVEKPAFVRSYQEAGSLKNLLIKIFYRVLQRRCLLPLQRGSRTPPGGWLQSLEELWNTDRGDRHSSLTDVVDDRALEAFDHDISLTGELDYLERYEELLDPVSLMMIMAQYRIDQPDIVQRCKERVRNELTRLRAMYARKKTNTLERKIRVFEHALEYDPSQAIQDDAVDVKDIGDFFEVSRQAVEQRIEKVMTQIRKSLTRRTAK